MGDDIYSSEDSKEPAIVTFFGPFPSSPVLSSFLELEVEFLGPLPKAPEVITKLDWEIAFPFGLCVGSPVAAKPEAIVMVHPMVRNYYHIRQIEERTGRVAIAKLGYIELVKP